MSGNAGGGATYLLVNHVPFGRGDAPGTVRASDLFLQDLQAQAVAVRAAGMRLVVATPLADDLGAGGGGASGKTVEFVPQDRGFDHLPLPHYRSFGQYLRVRRDLRRVLEDAIGRADVVQMGYGGHPVPLGSVVWPIAGRMGRKRIWMFDGGDPFPQWHVAADRIQNPIKRVLRRRHLRWFDGFCRRAVAGADLVIAHNNAVVQRFADVWGPHCHRFDRTFVTEDLLIDADQLRARQQRLLTDSPLRLVAAGRQIVIKGTDQLLRAIAAARRQGAQLTLDVFGDGDMLDEYRRLATELNLDDVVAFRGTVPYGRPLFDAWAERHVMVVTNLTSEFSRNLLLSMARGLPLITYSNPGDGIVEPSGAAAVVPMGDVDKLTEALVRADRDRAHLAKLAATALDVVRELTLDRCHQRRAELAAALIQSGPTSQVRPIDPAPAGAPAASSP